MLCLVEGFEAKAMLSKLFTNTFVVECSWTGRAFEKDATKFRILELK